MADKRKIDKVLGEGEMTPPDGGTKKVKTEPEDVDNGSSMATNAMQKIDKVLGEGEMTPPVGGTKKVKTEPEDVDNGSSMATNAMQKIDKVLGEGEMTPPVGGTKKVKTEPEDVDNGSSMATNAMQKIDKVLGEGEMTPPVGGTKKVKTEPEDVDNGSSMATNAMQKIDKVLGEGEMTPPNGGTKKVKTEPKDVDNGSSLATNAMPNENGQVRRFEPEVEQAQGMGLLEAYGNAQQPTVNWLELAPLAGNVNYTGFAPDYLQALFPDNGLMNQMAAFLAGNVAHGIAAPGIAAPGFIPSGYIAPGFLGLQGMPNEKNDEVSDSNDGVEIVNVRINRDTITMNTFDFPYANAKIQDAIYTRRKLEEININHLIQKVEKKTTDTTHFIYLMTDLEGELSLSVYPYTSTILGLEETSHNLILETYDLSSKLLQNLAQLMENIRFSSFQAFHVNVEDFFVLVKLASNVVHSITRMSNCAGPSNSRSVAIRALQFFPNYNGDPYNEFHMSTRVYNEKLFRDGKQTTNAFQGPIYEFLRIPGDSVLQFIAENYTRVHHKISMKNCFVRMKVFKEYLLARIECRRDTTAEFGTIYFENAKELEWINNGPIMFSREKTFRYLKATMISFEYVDNCFKLQGTAFVVGLPPRNELKKLLANAQVDVAHKEVGKDSCGATSSTQRPAGGNLAPQPPAGGNIAPQLVGGNLASEAFDLEDPTPQPGLGGDLAPQPVGENLAPQPPVGGNLASEAFDLEDPTPQPGVGGNLALQPPAGGNLASQPVGENLAPQPPAGGNLAPQPGVGGNLASEAFDLEDPTPQPGVGENLAPQPPAGGNLASQSVGENLAPQDLLEQA